MHCVRIIYDLQLEGGAAEDDGTSSSGSLERFRLLEPAPPRFAAEKLGRSGELDCVSRIRMWHYR